MLDIQEVKKLSFYDCNMEGFRKTFRPDMTKGQFWYRYKDDCRALLEKYNCKSYRDLWFVLHEQDIKEVMEKCTDHYQMEVKLGVNRYSLARYLRKLGWLKLENANGKTLAVRMRLCELFKGPNYSPIESYFYGYYLGDGYERKNEKGEPCSIGIMTCSPVDYECFRKIGEYLDCGDVIYESVGGKSLRIDISEREVVDRLKQNGLLFNSKCRNHPDFTVKSLDGFDFLMCLRGLIDSDGTMELDYKKHEYQRLRVRLVCGEIIEAFKTKLQSMGLTVRDCGWVPSDGRQQVYGFSLSRSELVKLLDLGIYEHYPDMVPDRKRIIDWRKT